MGKRPVATAPSSRKRLRALESRKLTSVAVAPRPAVDSPQGSLKRGLEIKMPFLSRARLALAGVVAVAAMLALVAVAVVNSGLFAATDIRIAGSEHVAQDAAEQLINLPEGTTLLNVDEERIVDALKQNPWVSGVEVKREYPHTLVITPRERAVAAIMYVAADDIAWAIGDDGCWIAPLSLAVTVDESGSIVESGIVTTEASEKAEGEAAATDGSSGDGASQGGADSASSDAAEAADADDDADGDGSAQSVRTDDASDAAGSEGTDASTESADDTADGQDATEVDSDGTRALLGVDAAEALAKHFGALLLTDVSSDVSPANGREVQSSVILAGMEYAEKFSSDFKAQIKYLSVPSEEAIAANLVSGVEVALGAPDDIAVKERVVTSLLSQQSGVTFIDVRTPNAYTFRSVPQ